MQLMDRVPEGEGIEPMLTVLETHIYQVSKLRRKQIMGIYYENYKMCIFLEGYKKTLKNFASLRPAHLGPLGKEWISKGGGMIYMHNLYTPEANTNDFFNWYVIFNT